VQVIRPLLLLTVTVVLAVPAYAQVSVDMHALDSVPGQTPAPPAAAAPAPETAAPSKPPPHGREARHPVQHPHPEARAAHPGKPGQATAKPATTAPAPPLPTAPPPEVRLAPASPAPPIQASPEVSPPPQPPSPDACTDVVSVGDGLRVTFVPGHSDITPDTEDMLHRFAHTVPDRPGVSVDVRAYASGSPDDASASRRMSLSRSLAVRAALIAGGVPSTRVFVRAFGPNAGDEWPDRVDVLLNRSGDDKPQPAAATPPPAAPPAAARTATP
jgi:outer membrane protein OmpA-like peptidoglycan-associated protein